ncbi:MAG: DUF3881 family protein [Clostridia bacterium]
MMERSQEDEEAYRSEEEWRRQMLKRAREGDEEALEELKADSLAMEEDILERLEEEDIYSILEGIFLPASEELLGVYTIMGTILESEKVLNPYTEEWVYRLLLNVMGVESHALHQSQRFSWRAASGNAVPGHRSTAGGGQLGPNPISAEGARYVLRGFQ